MSTVILAMSHWGYNKPGSHIRLFPEILKAFFGHSGHIENFNIATRNKSVKLKGETITSSQRVEEICTHVREKIERDATLYKAAFSGYFRLQTQNEIWLGFGIQQPYLFISAEDSIQFFLKEHGESAASNVRALIDLIEFLAQLEEIKEVVGRFADRITFFVGEPQLSYRPRIMERFFKGFDFEDAIEPFWRMYRVVTESVPREEIVTVLKAGAVEVREGEGGKVTARFCRALDEVEFDGNDIFRNVSNVVEGILKERGVPREW